MARTFGCPQAVAHRGIQFLGRAERMLRLSGLPRLCSHTMRLLQGDTGPHLDAYLAEARGLVRQVEAVLKGAEPRLQPEPQVGEIQAMANEAPAINAPSAPPAITSLG